MDPKDIEQLNQLAKKAKLPPGLTPEEKALQTRLRQAYREAVRQNLTAQLNATCVEYPDGTRKPLKPKDS